MYNDYYSDEEKILLGDSVNLLKSILKKCEFIIKNIKTKEQSDKKHDIRTIIISYLYREMIERVDGIYLLLTNNSTLNSKILLRSFFEIAIDLEKILKDFTNQTSLNYLYFKSGDYICKLEKFNEISETKKYNIREELKDLEKIAELYKLKCLERNHKKNIMKYKKEWWNYGKKTREPLREKVDDLLYKKLCEAVHGQNSIIDNFLRNEIPTLRSLRFLDDFGFIVYVIIYKFYIINKLILEQCIDIPLEEKEVRIKEIYEYLEASEKIKEKTNKIGLKF